jgi:kynurenine formamidase
MSRIFLIAMLFIFSCSQKEENKLNLENIEWIDLSYSFDSTTLYWPNNATGFVHTTDAEGITPLGYFYSSYSICTPEHGGTHLDAPIHFAKNKLTIDELPMTSLTGKAVVIDVSENALEDRDYLVKVSDVEAWEKENGQLEENTIVLFRTGYGKFYPDREKYFGTGLKGVEAIPLLHFPGIDPATTKWLVENRNIKALGLDTPSMDYGQSKDFQTHRILLDKNKPGFENVANLDKLPSKGIYVVALPMKIGKGSGAPLRIIAGVPSTK